MKKSLLVLSVLLLPSIAFANGSPIDFSEFHGVGNISMMQQRDISLEEENLWIEIDGDYANVRVEYKFQNNGPDTMVAYGFPLDLIINEYEEDESQITEPIAEFRMWDDSGILKVKNQLESPSVGKDIPVSDGGREYKIKRKWFVADLEFKSKKSKTLFVEYRIKSWLDDWLFSKSFSPRFSDRKFLYMLKPSKNWGNGIVSKFTAKIDLNKLLKIGGVVKEIKPRKYKVRGGVLEWQANNFDLNKADDIILVYDNAASQMSKFISEIRMPKELIVKCTTSSVLPTDSINKYSYGPDNLFDNDYNTAWVEGAKGHGIGEWVEVALDRVSASGIGIINGYTKKKRLYYANNRIKKLRLEVEWEDWGDRKGGRDTRELSLKQKEFNELNRNAEAPFITWLADYGDGYNRAKKVRLTILDVYPGTKYDDTPITELFILGNKFED